MKRITIIDDHEDHRMLYSAWLGESYDVAIHSNTESALKQIRSTRTDLIIIVPEDVEEPAFKTLKKIRQDEKLRHVPVIAITAHAMAGDRKRYLAAGFDHYLPMPILDESELLDVIEKALTV